MTPNFQPQPRPLRSRRSLRSLPYRREAAVLCAALVLAALVGACHDTVVQPAPGMRLPSAPAARSGGFSDDANFGAFDSPASATYDAVIDPWDAGSPPQIIGTFPYPTIVTIATSGSVQQVPGALNGDGLSWGPGLSLEGRINGSGNWNLDSGSTTVIVSSGDLRARRVPLASPQPYGDYNWSCGAQLGRDYPCWTFAGSAHLQLTRLDVGMTLTSDGPPAVIASRGTSAAMRSITAAATPSGTAIVARGTTVTFTAGKAQNVVNGVTVFMSAVSWRWRAEQPAIPDPTVAADTGACGPTAGVCSRAMVHSGTMYATAYINGKQQELPLHVDVRPSTATLHVICTPSNGSSSDSAGGTSSTVLRGKSVDCTATLSPKQAFIIVERHARAVGYQADLRDSVDSPNGDPYVWSGKAVLPTTVTMVAMLSNSPGTRVTSDTGSFNIIARTDTEWTNPKLLNLPRTPTTIHTAAQPLDPDPFASVRAGEQINSVDGALGKMLSVSLHPWGYLNEGPNGKMFYAKYPMSLKPDSTLIYVHAWLEDTSTFYRQQRGANNPVIGLRDCRGSDIHTLHQRVIDHENRHYTETKTYMDTGMVQKKWEGAFAPYDIALMIDSTSARPAQQQGEDRAYGTAMDQVTKIAVDRDYKVLMPSCKVQK
jgi:hypothetical protein